MIEEKIKRENETPLSLIRRFNKKLREAGTLRKARSLRFNVRPKSTLKKKQEAIKRVKKEKRLEYLRKLGKIK